MFSDSRKVDCWNSSSFSFIIRVSLPFLLLFSFSFYFFKIREVEAEGKCHQWLGVGLVYHFISGLRQRYLSKLSTDKGKWTKIKCCELIRALIAALQDDV